MFELDINKIKEQSMQFVDTAYKAAMDIADKGKNQLDLASQQNRLAKAQRQLGALVYSLHKANEENQPLVDKYIENIAEIEKAIEEIKARMTPDEAAAAEAAEAEQEAEDPNDPTTYHDDPAGLTHEEEQALPMRLTARAVRPKSAPSAMQMWMQTHCSATIAAHSCKQVTRLSNSNLYCFLDKTVE